MTVTRTHVAVLALLVAALTPRSAAVAVRRAPTPTPDPFWIPIDPHAFPPTEPADSVRVDYVKAPLLEVRARRFGEILRLKRGERGRRGRGE